MRLAVHSDGQFSKCVHLWHGSTVSVRPTPAQVADLRRCIARCDVTKGTYDYPNGDAIALRTGAALERRGWVVWANRYSANRRRRWLPTEAGRAAIAEIDAR